MNVSNEDGCDEDVTDDDVQFLYEKYGDIRSRMPAPLKMGMHVVFLIGSLVVMVATMTEAVWQVAGATCLGLTIGLLTAGSLDAISLVLDGLGLIGLAAMISSTTAMTHFGTLVTGVGIVAAAAVGYTCPLVLMDSVIRYRCKRPVQERQDG
jgi:hypothetical protein